MKRSFNAVSIALLLALGSALVPASAQTQGMVVVGWTQSPAQGPSARAGASIAYDSSRDVSYLFGGSTLTSSDLTGDTWQYDGRTWTQLQVTGPSPRYLAPMVFDSARGVSVLFGGYSNGIRGDTWEWDGTSWTQKAPAISPTPRLWTAMAYDSTRHVTVLFGGADGSGPLNDTWEYDGTTWTQIVTAHSPSARRGMGLAFDSARGRTVLFGGQDASGTDLNDTWEFDGTDWNQIATPSAPAPRLWHSMSYDAAVGGTLLFGGAAAQNVPQNDTWFYDGTSWQQIVTQPAPNPRFWASAAYDSVNGLLVLFGGDTTASSGDGQVFADTWSLRGVATDSPDWAPVNASTAPPPRVFPMMDYDSARSVSVLFGGSRDGGPGTLNDTWEWNGSTWTLMSPVVSPSAVAGATMAYDSARGVSVLFGGSGASGASSSTWEWDGTTWTQRNPAVSPSARVWAAMAYDASHGQMVMFGGDASDTGTWLYDGNNWTRVSPTPSPSPRMGAAMAFDPTRGRIVLFGGRDASGQRLGDTWEWDGASWTQIAVAMAPYPRFWSSLAFDSLRGKVVLFGGDHIQPYAFGEENDTWDWNGSVWTRDWTSTAPPIRAGHSMVFDSARSETVLFGGMNAETSPTTVFGDTWLLGGHIQAATIGPSAVLSSGGQGANFGNVNVGATSANSGAFFVSSSGSAPLTINSITTTGDFVVSSTDCPPATDVLASGSYCTTLVNFQPTAGGVRTGTLTISDNVVGGSFVVQLQGTGVQIPTSLSLTPAVALYSTAASFNATLSANGSPLSGQALRFSLPSGLTATLTTDGQGTATWAGASLAGLGIGTYPAGIQVSFAGTAAYAPSSATGQLTITQPVKTSYAGDYYVADTNSARLAITIDQRTPASDPQFLDYGSTSVWVRFTVTGGAGSTDFYAPVADAADWATSGLGVAAVNVPALPDGGYTVIATLVTASGSTTPSTAVAGDDVRVGLVSSPTKGGYLSGGGAIATDPSANTQDTHGYFSFQMKPASTPQGSLVYVYRVNMDIGGGTLRDVDVWVTSIDVTTLSGNGSSAVATGHFSVAYVDAETGQRYAGFEFSGGTYKVTATNATAKSSAGFALVLERPDGTLFHATAPVNNGGNAPTAPVVLGTLTCNL